MEKKICLIDVDEVICLSGFLSAVNEFMGTNYKLDDFTEYYIDAVAIPKECFGEWNEYLNSINLYDRAVLMPGAKETLEKLNYLYKLGIVSSCVNSLNIQGSGRLFKDKYDWLLSNLPFIDPHKFIFTSAKELIKGDIIIDDRKPNLNGDIPAKILFPAYHNRNILQFDLMDEGIIKAGDDWQTGWEYVGKILIDENGDAPSEITYPNLRKIKK